jgi:pyruvate,water dikinase
VPADHDAVTTWLPDPSHYPEQMTPLSATTWFEALGGGLHEAMRELRGPFGGLRTRTELGWAYEAELEPEWEPEPERLREAALTLGERWDAELRPRVEAITAELHALRPERPPPDEAQRVFDRMWKLVREQWKLHFLVVIPAQIAAEVLHDRYVELFGDDDPLAPYRLLEGLPNEADAEVVRLSRRARELAVDHLLREHAPPHALERLRETGGGRRFLHELDAYLQRYGGRSRWHELSLPREAEAPTMTVESVRLLLEAGEPPAGRRREPPPPELAQLYERVAPAYALKETHAHVIDYPGLLATREVLLGFGRRLVAEAMLRAVDDVWMLEREELRAALVDDAPLGALVATRRAELARGLAEGPPPFLGDTPPETERHSALEKFYGSGGRGLSGAGASPGVAEGTARIVSGPDDFARVRPGDVLVARTTTPAWTPLFPSIAALVTDTGGILSHAAVVAREYAIPAVVGAEAATTLIADGARVRVDGSRGEVSLL